MGAAFTRGASTTSSRTARITSTARSVLLLGSYFLLLECLLLGCFLRAVRTSISRGLRLRCCSQCRSLLRQCCAHYRCRSGCVAACNDSINERRSTNG